MKYGGKKAFEDKNNQEFHRLAGLPKPEHPLISVVYYDAFRQKAIDSENNTVFDFYAISLKRSAKNKYRYGQQQYDFDDGVMFFMAPNQVFGINTEENPVKPSGWMLLIHPDFLWNTSLAKTIKHYAYFDYEANEALFLSHKEEATINQIIQNIEKEYHSNIDKFSKQIIISQIETLLNYSDRFYNRQFITREKDNHQTLERLEKWLADYFNNEELSAKGLPTVQDISEALNVSVSYLSRLLKVLTGQSTQQHIHDKLIERAKEKLSTTNLSVSEIAYELGFEHSQSFSRLFKSKTNQSPLEFRAHFN